LQYVTKDAVLNAEQLTFDILVTTYWHKTKRFKPFMALFLKLEASMLWECWTCCRVWFRNVSLTNELNVNLMF